MDTQVGARQPGDPKRLGPYELLGRLGQGGMGVVYLGRERRGGHRAAVKAIRPELAGDPAFAARFRREVEAARRVDSPRVARVLGADPASPRPWLATEYVDGPTLAGAVASGGPLTGGRLAAFAAGVAAEHCSGDREHGKAAAAQDRDEDEEVGWDEDQECEEEEERKGCAQQERPKKRETPTTTPSTTPTPPTGPPPGEVLGS
jgi:hypothetical protein